MNPQTSKRLRESDDEDAQNSTPEQKDGNGNGKTVIWKTRIISRCEEGYPLRLGDEHPVVPVEALDTETLPSCVSLEPKIGDPPSCDWPAFRRPKLRRFPDASSLELKTHLAEGVDGIVFRARSGDREVVVKMFRHSRPVEGLAYWAFARECKNAAVLELIQAGIRHAKDQGQPIMIDPAPIDQSHAYRNLKSFSRDYIGNHEHPPSFKPFQMQTEVNQCLGWIKLTGHTVQGYARCGIEDTYVAQDHYAIVYPWVPPGDLILEDLQCQLDFFWHTGFGVALVSPRNYRGSSMLVDFSDIVLPHDRGWHPFGYGCVATIGSRGEILTGNRPEIRENQERIFRKRLRRLKEKREASRYQRLSNAPTQFT